jgi:hypothetical protein
MIIIYKYSIYFLRYRIIRDRESCATVFGGYISNRFKKVCVEDSGLLKEINL